MTHPHITCPYCLMGYGAPKVAKKVYHLEIFSGVLECEQPDYVRSNTISVDECENPTFYAEYARQLEELRGEFEENPVDWNKDTVTINAFLIAFRELIDYNLFVDDDKDLQEDIAIDDVRKLYEEGMNLKDCILHFVNDTLLI